MDNGHKFHFQNYETPRISCHDSNTNPLLFRGILNDTNRARLNKNYLTVVQLIDKSKELSTLVRVIKIKEIFRTDYYE